MKFLAICARNLDEFFQVRVAGLKAQVDAGVLARARPTGAARASSSQEIRLRVLELVRAPGARAREGAAAARSPSRASASSTGTSSTRATDAAPAPRVREPIFPVLTPLAVDPAHPFPYISNLSLNLAVLVRDAGTASAASRA